MSCPHGKHGTEYCSDCYVELLLKENINLRKMANSLANYLEEANSLLCDQDMIDDYEELEDACDLIKEARKLANG